MKKPIFIALLLICGIFSLSAQEINIIPQPTSVKKQSGEYSITNKTSIQYEKGLKDQAVYLQNMLEKSTGFIIAISEGKGKPEAIILSIDKKKVVKAEAYELTVSTGGVTILGADKGGVFYGIQTLLQLFPAEIYKDVTDRSINYTAPAVIVKDAPMYEWRGMMFDVARYFFDKEFIKKYIDMMAMYKLNRLQLHLVDDSGWRLEIKKYPRLTEVGAWAGDGAYRLGGFYTQEDIKEIVAYAAVRNVDVIPEIAMPAHMLSAIVAYPWLSCTGMQHEVPDQHFISRDLLCMGKETSFTFLEDIFAETSALFPSKYFNIGGDEARYSNYDKCPKCQAVMKKEGLGKSSELQGHLTNVVSNMLKKHNRTVVGWQEITQRGDLDNKVISAIWTNHKFAKDATAKGHSVIITPASHMYFDFPESNIPGEPMAAKWKGPISVEKCYSLKVGTLADSLVAGVQACFWSDVFIHKGTNLHEISSLNENRSERYAEYLTFPRLLALSEVGWSVESKRNYKDFANRLQHHYTKLDNKGCNYRVPLPIIVSSKAVSGGFEFKMDKSVVGSKITYTTDGSYPHALSKEYTGAVVVEDLNKFKAITVLPSRHTSLPIFIPKTYGEYKKFGAFTGEWESKDINDKEFVKFRIEATGKISRKSKYDITFIHLEGNSQLEIQSVKIFKRDAILGEDVHLGSTGKESSNNTYVIDVPDFEAGTPYYIEAMVRGVSGNDTAGAVFIKRSQNKKK